MEKTGQSPDGRTLHFSVGALIRRGDQYLLIDRAVPPFGFAGIAGHIDEGEEPIAALKREVAEEGNITVTDEKLLFEETFDWNWCSRGVWNHHWYLFECTFVGDPKINEESKSMGWYTAEQIKVLTLEPAWAYWFKKLGII